MALVAIALLVVAVSGCGGAERAWMDYLPQSPSSVVVIFQRIDTDLGADKQRVLGLVRQMKSGAQVDPGGAEARDFRLFEVYVRSRFRLSPVSREFISGVLNDGLKYADEEGLATRLALRYANYCDGKYAGPALERLAAKIPRQSDQDAPVPELNVGP